MYNRLKKFFSKPYKVVGGIGKGKSKSLIYAFFEPLKENNKISDKEFEQIISSKKKNTETYLTDLFGEKRANEIKQALKSIHITDG